MKAIIYRNHHARRAGKRRRRGSMYVVVVAVALIVSTIGLSMIALSRIRARRTTRADDWAEAAILAHAALELGLAQVNGDPDWRTTFEPQHATPGPETSLGNGTVSWMIEDEEDGTLAAPDTGLRLSGIGKVGETTRVYSVQIEGPPQSLEVFLRTTYSAADVTVNALMTAADGAVSTPGTFTNLATITGDVEAGTLDNTGTITGTITIPFEPLTMPSPDVFDTYLVELATEIPFGGIAAGKIEKTVLSAASNPYGSADPDAVYSISVPANGTLIISQTRLVATLLVTLNENAGLLVSDANLWQTPDGNYPMLIVKGTTGSTVDLNGFAQSELKEKTCKTNFNPPGTPYDGATDDDQDDVYPNEFNGLIHVIGSATAFNVGNDVVLKGSLVSEGRVTFNGGYTVTLDPGLYENPPYRYIGSSGTVVPVAGTWRWDAPP